MSFDYKEWYYFIKGYFSKIEVSFNYVGISGKGYFKEIVNIEKGEKKLISKKFKDIEDLSLYLSNNNSNAPTYDWIIYASSSFGICGHELDFSIDETLIGFDSPEFIELIMKLSKFGNFGMA
jgi:hypothetical protein